VAKTFLDFPSWIVSVPGPLLPTPSTDFLDRLSRLSQVGYERYREDDTDRPKADRQWVEHITKYGQTIPIVVTEGLAMGKNAITMDDSEMWNSVRSSHSRFKGEQRHLL
jgi:hypothetical protein